MTRRSGNASEIIARAEAGDSLAVTRRGRPVARIVPITRSRLEELRDAGLLDPRSMRSLGAVHLAAAIDLGDDCTGVLTSDARLADAARHLGFDVIAPS